MALSFTGHTRSTGNADEESGVPLAPLIDIIFILLIFFLVTATFTDPAGLTVERPGASTADSLPEESTIITITDDEQIHLNDRPARLSLLAERIRSEVARPRDASVVIAADQAVSTGLLVTVMDAARSAGVRDVSIATRERSE